MYPLYVDVTEIYHLGRRAAEVTGVARVVLEIAYELCRSGRAIPIINDEARRTLFTLDPEVFSETILYDAHARIAALGKPQKYRDPERFAPKSFSRFQVMCQNRVRSFSHRIKFDLSDAVTGQACVEDHAILCMGHPATGRRTLKRAKVMGGFARAVVLIHDIIRVLPEEGGGLSRTAETERRSIEICKELGVVWAANSKFTRDEIARMTEAGRLPHLQGDVKVIPLAHEMRRDPSAAPFENPNPDEPYFLTVGGLDGRKNGQVLVDAMVRISEEDGSQAVPLVIAAGRSERHALLDEVQSLTKYAGIKDRIRWAGNPKHAQLHDLYTGAAATIYPSKYEGFGLPVGESLWCGTPAFASTATSIPEVGGNLARYFDWDDDLKLAGLLQDFRDNPESEKAQRALIEQCRGDLRSWAQVAKDYAALACLA